MLIEYFHVVNPINANYPCSQGSYMNKHLNGKSKINMTGEHRDGQQVNPEGSEDSQRLSKMPRARIKENVQGRKTKYTRVERRENCDAFK